METKKLDGQTREEFDSALREGNFSDYVTPENSRALDEYIKQSGEEGASRILEEVYCLFESRQRKESFYTDFLYNCIVSAKGSGKTVSPQFTEKFAKTIVDSLAIEDLECCLSKYVEMLVNLGTPSIKPLEQFCETEGLERRKEGCFYPTQENYRYAHLALQRLRNAP